MLRIIFIVIAFMIAFVQSDEYEDKIQFILHSNGKSQVSTFNGTLGCDPRGNFSFVTHGWKGSTSPWIPDLISNLSFHRNGCVVFMNYSHYSDRNNYFEVISHFEPISKLVARKLRQVRDSGFSSDNMFLFGFSFGGRIVIEAALLYGPKRINQIDTCDMAGPGFDFIYSKDPKGAAKNVQCIHTSISAGTAERNCHQDWLMGHCGKYQDAAESFQAVYCEIVKNCSDQPMLSHSLCPYFYNAAFKHDFVANNVHKCSSKRMITNLPKKFKMGFMETRRR